MVHEDSPVDNHSQRDEEKACEGVAERDDVAGCAVTIVGVGEEHAREKRSEGDR